MKHSKILQFIGVLTLTLLWSGCIVIGNRGDAHDRNATVGQQLIDLQKAKDAGLISDAEYQAQKAKILRK